MSAIFDALKKMNAKKKGPEKGKKPASIRERRNVYTLSQIILSPFILLPVTLVVVGGVFLFYYMSDYYTEPVPFPVAQETAAQSVTGGKIAPGPSDGSAKKEADASEMDDFPEPPDIVKDDRLEQTVQSDIDQDGVTKTDMSAPALSASQRTASSGTYSNPRSFDGRDYAENYKIAAGESAYLPPKGENVGPQEGAALPSENPSSAGPGPLVSSAMNPLPNNRGIPQEPGLAAAAYGSNSLQVQSGNFPSQDKNHEPNEIPDVDSSEMIRLKIADTGKGVEVARLVKTIEKEIRHGQKGFPVEKLLNQLASLKGNDDAYVMKLKAFVLMEKGEYARAETLLKKVLSKNKNDLEAGMNMAVVEMNTGKQERAGERLRDLLKVYPDNTTLYEMTRKLK